MNTAFTHREKRAGTQQTRQARERLDDKDQEDE